MAPSSQDVLVISNEEYNDVEELAVWALAVVREVPHPNRLTAVEEAIRDFLELP